MDDIYREEHRERNAKNLGKRKLLKDGCQCHVRVKIFANFEIKMPDSWKNFWSDIFEGVVTQALHKSQTLMRSSIPRRSQPGVSRCACFDPQNLSKDTTASPPVLALGLTIVPPISQMDIRKTSSCQDELIKKYSRTITDINSGMHEPAAEDVGNQ